VRAKLALAAVSYLLGAVRCGDTKEQRNAVLDELSEAYQQCLERRTCKLQIVSRSFSHVYDGFSRVPHWQKFFVELSQRQTWLGSAFLLRLTTVTQSATIASGYLRTEALGLLTRLLGQQRQHPTPEQMAVVPSVSWEASKIVVSTACDPHCDVRYITRARTMLNIVWTAMQIKSLELLLYPSKISDDATKPKAKAQRVKQLLVFTLAVVNYTRRCVRHRGWAHP
jgi:hypothetical protein